MDYRYRIVFDMTENLVLAEHLLDSAGIKFDYDSGGRMMITQEGLDILDNNDIDCCDYNIVAEC